MRSDPFMRHKGKRLHQGKPVSASVLKLARLPVFNLISGRCSRETAAA